MGSFTGGLGSQLGLDTETEYGVWKEPALFLPYNPGETMKLSRNYLMSKGLRAGREFQASALRVPTTRAASGTVSMEVLNQGFGTILNLLHGNAVTPSKEGATTIYKQKHDIGLTDPYKKSVTMQIGKPTVEGKVEPYNYPGSVLTALELAQNQGFLTANMTFDSNDEETAKGLATASYATELEPFTFVQCVVKVNSVEQKLARVANVKLTTAKDTARYPLGKTKKLIPLTNGYIGGTIELTVDYSDNTLLKFFQEGEKKPVELIWTGVTTEAIVTKLALKMESCGFDGDSPNVANEGELQQVIPLVILDDGTHPPIEATYVSKDKEIA